MVCCFLLLWAVAIVAYGPRLWHAVAGGQNALEVGVMAVFCGMLVLFWLLAAYYAAVLLFSLLSRARPVPAGSCQDPCSEIAILYPTCNDFQVEAAESCLRQGYGRFHLFLLDDSTQSQSRELVDEFHSAYPERTTVVRRGIHGGFKAGNLNHALAGEAARYEYFAVVDADERLPPDFLSRAIAPLQRDPELAFVQANHSPNPQQNSQFARDIGSAILPFWHVHCHPRNRYGFVPFVGHGAVVRRSAWETVGGFPELITEDLGFSLALCQRGLRGLFLKDLLCHEDFPSSYPAFKRQQERYIIGTTQIMFRFIPSILRSDKMTWIEKFDFFLWCSPLYVPAMVLIFTAMGSLGLSALFGQWQRPTVSLFGFIFTLPGAITFREPYRLLCSWDFQIFSVVCALSPAFASIALGFQKKLNAFRLLTLSTVPYLSLMVVAWRGILGYVFKGRVIFPPTGENSTGQGEEDNQQSATRTMSERNRSVSWRPPTAWEVSAGVVMALASLLSANLGMFAVSSCLLVGVAIDRIGWERRITRIATACCFAVILLHMVGSIAFQTGPAGTAPLIFSVHF
jgi:cellulose synthase/poly-beta-1,6-N-acetylglucosamine synthase-like glycosyltransferase